VEGGLPPEALILEMYMSGEMEAVWRGFRTEGFQRSAATHGATAQFGGLLRAMQFFQTGLYEQFQKTLEEISGHQFANQFQAERAAGYPNLAMVQAMTPLDRLTDAEQRLRVRLQQP
jgi:ketol-acid reductoisomerase